MGLEPLAAIHQALRVIWAGIVPATMLSSTCEERKARRTIRNTYWLVMPSRRPMASSVKQLSASNSCHYARPCTTAFTKVRSIAGAAARPLGVISLSAHRAPPLNRLVAAKASCLMGLEPRAVTLRPGDIIATGTPSGVGFRRKPRVYMKLAHCWNPE